MQPCSYDAPELNTPASGREGGVPSRVCRAVREFTGLRVQCTQRERCGRTQRAGSVSMEGGHTVCRRLGVACLGRLGPV